jgi:hypothetical protein
MTRDSASASDTKQSLLLTQVRQDLAAVYGELPKFGLSCGF